MDSRLHRAADRTLNCSSTLMGKHVFHRVTKYIPEGRGRKKILDEWRCKCGLRPANEEYVAEHWKPGRRHEEELQG